MKGFKDKTAVVVSHYLRTGDRRGEITTIIGEYSQRQAQEIATGLRAYMRTPHGRQAFRRRGYNPLVMVLAPGLLAQWRGQRVEAAA